MPHRAISALPTNSVTQPKSWQCRFCGNYATLRSEDSVYQTATIANHDRSTGEKIDVLLTRCPNAKCGKIEVAVSHVTGKFSPTVTGIQLVGGTAKRWWRLVPESAAKQWPPCVPSVLVKDYEEGCLIVDKSPKASATLSRRVLQGMIADFWGIKQRGKTKTLAKQIEALKGKVEVEVWDAIDALRRLGNIGAHMEKDINIIVDVEPNEAAALIGLIEMLFEEWYVAREKRANSLKAITAIAAGKKPTASPVPTPVVPSAGISALPASAPAQPASTPTPPTTLQTP